MPLIEGLLAPAARVQAHDPHAMENVRGVFGDRITYAADPYAAAHGADALVVVTEWLVYRNPDFERLRSEMAGRVLVDGRNLYDAGAHARPRVRVCLHRPAVSGRSGSTMNVSPEHLIQQARERFAVQDYRGAAFLLEEVVAGGRAFADVHHLLGVSYSL